ncbi:15390_t:CDS:2, partial [Cetraspora pellucida]
MEFSENLDQFFETHNEPTSESDYDEIEKDLCSDEELENTSDDDTTFTDPNKTLSMILKDLVKKLQQCCKCKEKCDEKVSLTLLESLALESITMNKKKHYHSMSILLAASNFDLYIKEDKIRSYQLPYFEHKSMLPKPHGNTGCQPKNILPIETANKAKFFIKSFGDQHGEKQAVRKYIRKKKDGQITVNYEKDDVILLLSHYSYSRLLDLYNLMNPKNLINSHVCDECTLYKRALKESSNYVNEDLDEQLITHVSDYRKLREVYENDIQKAKSSDHSSFLHQFGLVNEGIDKHWHAIYTEGKASKGPNEVTSILNHFLVSVTGEAKEIKLWADNCGGQNKNSCLLWYLLWLCNTKIFHKIDYQFQIKSHTRNSVDRGFGRTKLEYAKSEAWCIDHLFTYKKPGLMRAKIRVKDSWDEFQLLKKDANPVNLSPQKLPSKGLSEEKQVDFWNKIHPYCPTEFQDKLCPRPTDDVVKRIGKLKGDRAKEAQ